jgi:hypothetical protein
VFASKVWIQRSQYRNAIASGWSRAHDILIWSHTTRRYRVAVLTSSNNDDSYIRAIAILVLVLAGLLLTAEFYRTGQRASSMPFAYRYLLAVVYLSPWFTQSIAMMTGVQIYTLAVAAFGIYQLDQCAANLWLGISFERGARLRWQSQPRRLGRFTRLRGFRAGDNYGQVLAGIEIDFFR